MYAAVYISSFRLLRLSAVQSNPELPLDTKQMRLPYPGRERTVLSVERFDGAEPHRVDDIVATEEPLEIHLVFGKRLGRQVKSLSVTMRTPGNDAELALGFLLSEGIVRGIDDVECVTSSDRNSTHNTDPPERRYWQASNVVSVELVPDLALNLAALQRNFYTTSGCGVCGKTSLLALRSICPARVDDGVQIKARALYELHSRLRQAQCVFRDTGGIHSAALFSAEGELLNIREDVGRHNALDKIIGAAMLHDDLPLRNRLLLLSGRASFELLQKAVTAGIPLVVAVGAPSSLAVAVAAEFDVTLIGFLREDHFNVYHGARRVLVDKER
jgi:FdhD protein